MKDVKQCSISSVAFTLEVDAYDTLYNYIESIRARYKDDEDGEEILSDIEARIAELILSTHSADRVVAKPLVDNIIAQMGTVDDICDEEPNAESESDNDAQQPKGRARRHLYRNIDDAPIGGVCSGIAAYIGCSVAIVRLIALLLVFVGGASAWIYVVLWIVMPAAVTARQKMEMRGDPITVSSIKDYYESMAQSEASREAVSFISSFFATIGRVIMILFKIVVVCILIALVLSFVTAVVGVFAVIVMNGAISSGFGANAVAIMALTSIAMLLAVGIYVAIQIINSRRVKASAIITTLIIWFLLSLSTAGIVAYRNDDIGEFLEGLEWRWSGAAEGDDRPSRSSEEKMMTLKRLEIIYSEGEGL